MLLLDFFDAAETVRVNAGSAEAALMSFDRCPLSTASCSICPIFHARRSTTHPAAATYMNPQ